LNLRVFNPTVEGEPGGVTLSLQNRDVESGSRTTQFSLRPTDIILTTDFSGDQNEWTFGADGTLMLPAGGDIVDSNGTSVLGGGSSELYSPATIADWIGSPTVATFTQGLDELASRMVNVEFARPTELTKCSYTRY